MTPPTATPRPPRPPPPPPPWGAARPPPPPPAAPPPLPAPLAEPTPVWREYAAAVGIVALSTALCFVLRSRLKTVDVAMVLLLGVVAVAALCRAAAPSPDRKSTR